MTTLPSHMHDNPTALDLHQEAKEVPTVKKLGMYMAQIFSRSNLAHRLTCLSGKGYTIPRPQAVTMATKSQLPDVTAEPLMCYSWLCPYVHRVTLALSLKKVDIWRNLKKVDIDLNNKPDWLPHFSPLGKVPAITYLEDGKQQVLYESLALLHWVDDYYGDKGRDLLPGSAAHCTKARIIMSRFDNNAVMAWYLALKARDQQEFKNHLDKWHKEMRWLEDNMDPAGPFLMGSQPSMVDAAVLPWILRANVLKHYRNVDLLQGHPKIQAWVDKCNALPEVQAVYHAPSGDNFDAWKKDMIPAYTKYGGDPLDFSA